MVVKNRLLKGIQNMLNEKVTKLLNEQINKEFFSAYLYLDMSNFYSNHGLLGFANWFKVQAQEERDHALLFSQYLQNNNFDVTLDAIAKPDSKYSDYKAPLVQSLEHERFITASIYTIYKAAQEASDFRTIEFLNWFVKEQGEEEMNAENLIQRFELFGSDPKSLYLLDTELAARTYTAPTLVL
jgi:ferritin